MFLKLTGWRHAVVCLGLSGSAGHQPAKMPAQEIPPATLAVWSGGQWVEWWNSASAPDRWIGPLTAVERALQWRAATPGVQWSELRMAGRAEAWRVRIIVARLDLHHVRFRIDTAFLDHGARPGWSIERARPEALVAVNAGQFPRSLPWGWVVLDGHE